MFLALPVMVMLLAGPGDVSLGKVLSGQTKPLSEESEDEGKKESYCW